MLQIWEQYFQAFGSDLGVLHNSPSGVRKYTGSFSDQLLAFNSYYIDPMLHVFTDACVSHSWSS